MYKSIFSFVLVFLLNACSSHKTDIKGYEKAFAQEDIYIVLALRAEEKRSYKEASKIFDILYEKSYKKEYLYHSLNDLLMAKKYDEILKKVELDKKDLILRRMEIIALINLYRVKEAEEKALELVKQTRDANDYILVSDLYISQKKFDKALKYLESAYMKDYNEKILDKIATILYVNLGRKKEAIAQLETHSRVYNCSKLICGKLISFYSDENNIDGLLSAYLRYYKVDANEKVAEKIIQIYNYKQDYIKLIDFLKENDINNRLLLDLYIKIEDYKKAYKLAELLYEKTGDIEYLGKSAIYEYEAKNKNLTKNDISHIISKFRKVVLQKETALYLNYYGYLLIDHNVDIAQGIKYIKKALELQPNASFYLDSLAWGYYKQHKCKKAKLVMDKVVKLGASKYKEILSHKNIIDKCLKKIKKEKNDFR
ncbi:MAG: hypothetical protein ABGW74_06110 [Campylobacterales bacterium]